MRHPPRSAVDLFRSRWWSIGGGEALVLGVLKLLRSRGQVAVRLRQYQLVLTPATAQLAA